MKWFNSDRDVRYLVVFLALLSFGLFTFGSLQYQRYARINTAAQTDSGSLLWIIYQLEREHNRWNAALELLAQAPSEAHWQQAKLNYEIFVSRVDLLHSSPVVDSLRAQPDYQDSAQVLAPYVEAGDALVAGPNPSAATLAGWLVRADEIDVVLRRLTNRANTQVYHYIEDTNLTLQNQGKWLLGMLGVQVLILLASLYGLARLLTWQRRQNKTLRALSSQYDNARAQAEAANRAKDTFLANMSHELRTPFQGMLGMLDLLATTEQTPQQKDYTQTARESAQHLLGLLGDMLDISTIEAGALRLELTAVDVPAIAREVLALMQPAARIKHLQLSLQIDPALRAWMQADAKRLRQIMFNLLTNAIKFTAQGSVSLRLEPLQKGQRTDEANGLCLVVQDTGIGMDEQAQAHVFSRFYQADGSIRRRYGGTGLGLEISRRLARLMGGDITVRSALGQGSTFTVSLPLAVAPAPATTPLLLPEPDAVAPSATVSETSSAAGSAFTKPMSLRVLVAEDYAVGQKFLRAMLAHLGHHAQVCDNGRQVLDALVAQDFDLVLMDLHMPELDGLSATRAIRTLGTPKAKIPVVMISADALPETRQQAFDAGVDAFLTKPLSAQVLQEQLQRSAAVASAYALMPSPRTRSPNEVAVLDEDLFTQFASLMPATTLSNMARDLFEPPCGQMPRLQQAVLADALDLVQELAHTAKGACQMIGLRALAAQLVLLETVAARGEPVAALAPSLLECSHEAEQAFSLARQTYLALPEHAA
jgi:two-component system, sensor histidine kinase